MFPGVGMPTTRHHDSFLPLIPAHFSQKTLLLIFQLHIFFTLEPQLSIILAYYIVSLNFCHLFTQIWWRELVTREHVFTADIAYHKISRIYVDVQNLKCHIIIMIMVTNDVW